MPLKNAWRKRQELASQRPWSPEEVSMFALVVNRAPSVHNTQPWSLHVVGRQASLFERSAPAVDVHDHTGRDRVISGGAALTHLELAIRHSGWSSSRQIGPDGQGALATVTATRFQSPTDDEEARFRAIAARASHRHPFRGERLTTSQVEAIATTDRSESDVVGFHQANDPARAAALAELLHYSARVHQDDTAYQRELSAWTVQEATAARQRSFDGIPADGLPLSGLSTAGLATPMAALPDREALAERIASEDVFVITTATDDRRSQLLAGAALQRAWLTATSLGLAASVMTQPLRLPEVRAEIAASWGLSGVAQIVLRVGNRAGAAPRSPRRPVTDLFQT